MCLDLNGFKEAISQQESEEENGCGLIVFGVTFLCLCHFPGLWAKSGEALK